MTNSKSTKRALVSSTLAVLLCVAMLIGTTYAWFTDTASTAVNTIQSGTLKVDIIGATTDDSIVGTGLKFVDANNNTNILWEPNATFRTEGFRIANKGNLALKYTLVLNGVTGDAELLDVIEFSVVKADGTEVKLDKFVGNLEANEIEEDVLYIQGHMKAEAGNKYQNKELTGLGITVYATQDTVESDSTGNQYDKDASNVVGNVYYVSSYADLKNAAENAVSGDVIHLNNDITVTEGVVFNADEILFDGAGHTITCNGVADNDGVTVLQFGSNNHYCDDGVTVRNLSITGTGKGALRFHGGASSLIENVTVSGNWYLAVNFFGTHGATMNNCNISSNATIKWCKSTVFANEQSAYQLILNNTKIDSIFVNATDKGSSYANNGVKLVVNDGSTVATMYTNEGIAREFYKVNGTGAINNIINTLDFTLDENVKGY